MTKENLLRFNYRQKYLVVDFETEGLNLVSSRPWQVSWIICEGKTIKSKHDKFILWEDLNVSKDAARITNFNYQNYLQVAEDPKKVFDEFERYFYNPEYLIIGQNILGFDVYMLNVWRKSLNLPSDYSFMNRIIDTKSLSTAIAKNILPDKGNFLSWQYKLLNHKEKGLKTSQSHMLKHYNIEHDPRKLHDSLYDVEMTFQIFLKQIYDIEV